MAEKSLGVLRESIVEAVFSAKLFQRVITVSLETMKIVRGLPKLEIT